MLPDSVSHICRTLHHSVNSLQLPFSSICKILASTHPLPPALTHMHVETVCILREGSLHHSLCSPTHSWPTGHSAVWHRTLLHVHTVPLPYYKHLHPLLCELTVSQLPNGWPFPVPRVIRFQVIIVSVLQMTLFLGFRTMQTFAETFWMNVQPPLSRWLNLVQVDAEVNGRLCSGDTQVDRITW
jgi:hypothetical protein